MSNKIITAQDIMPISEYLKIRKEYRQKIVEIKKNRRVAIGPYATCLFESYDTMLFQVQEMLAIEKGGDEQLADELAAYNPMIPQGHELTATIMFEIDDAYRRAQFLGKIGGIEKNLFIKFGNEQIFCTAEEDVERTTDEGKASSVHFVHFIFNAQQIKDFKSSKDAFIGFNHPNYSHLAMLNSDDIANLSKDFA